MGAHMAEQFDTEYFLKYYENYRNKLDDLFKSEKYFMPEFVLPKKSYLDVGCAVGGMYEILTAFESNVDYKGIDVSSEMIDCAKINYPEIDFEVGDAAKGLCFKDNAFSRVITLGTTVHEQNYKSLLKESYRVAEDVLFFDIRLVYDKPTLNDLGRGYVEDESDIQYPYVVVNYDELVEFFNSLRPLPRLIKSFGYWGKANEYTTLPADYHEICMAAFLVYKDDSCVHKAIDFKLNLPVLK